MTKIGERGQTNLALASAEHVRVALPETELLH